MGAVLTMGGILACGNGLAQSSRIPSGALPSGPATQALVSGSATIRQPQVVTGGFNPYQVNGNIATITQTDAAGILHWDRFDIGSAAQVIVNQPNSAAVLLNKIDGGAYMSKTVIEGMLTGKGGGQIYIYNPNGIIFGKNATVDVGSLIASTLRISDSRFIAGLLSPDGSPAFALDNTVAGANASAIVVEGASNGSGGIDQAHITAARGGKILLLAPSVSNNGVLSAPDGQVALAGGGKVYLSSPSDLRMRGLLIEVDSSNLGGLGTTATNDTLGKILVERGNASMVGLAVNQMGTISATTSVSLNGSIFLRARDGANAPADSSTPTTSTTGGALVLGADSVTEILPTLDDKSTALASAYQSSWVDLAGQTVHLQQNASVIAPGGEVDVAGFASPKNRTPGSSGRVYLEPGAKIDVSGTTSTVLPMESNVITVQLRGAELADVPLQRNAVFRGQDLKIDIRKGTPLANVQGWLNLVEHNVGELTATGGKVVFRADSDVILNNGSSVNVSGGKVTYGSGYVATTQLQSYGRVVDIGSATPDRIYEGFNNPAPGPRNFELGYSEGRSAGTIVFDTNSLVARGDLLGTASPGPRQRDVSSSSYPKGGELIVGNDLTLGSIGSYLNFDFLGRVDFGGTSTESTPTPVFADGALAANNPLRLTLDLSLSKLEADGFSRLRAYTLGDIVVSAPAGLAAGGELTLAAQNGIEFKAGVNIPSGAVSASSATGSVTVDKNLAFDLAGLWTNDYGVSRPAVDAQGNPIATIATGGGTFLLSGYNVLVGDGASFDVSGGAWQNASGKIAAGKGGSIFIDAKPEDVKVPLASINSGSLQLGSGIDFFGYGMSTGGKLRLTGRNASIGGIAADPLDFSLTADFFKQGGFSSFDIRAAGNLTVVGGATIAPTMQTWFANRDTAAQSSGRMRDAFDITTLPLAGVAGSRGAASLSLTASAEWLDDGGRLWLQPGASIATDPGGTVTLSAGRQMTVDGDIAAPGGAINLYLTPVDGSIPYRAERSIWIGSNSILTARGTADRVWKDGNGASHGEVLDGGKIQIGRAGASFGAANGYVVVEQGAQLDVSGAVGEMALTIPRQGQTTRKVASAGGSIDIRASEGLLFAGSMSAAGGDASVAAGSLTLALDREAGLASLGGTGAPSGDRNLQILRLLPNAGIVPAGLQADQPIVGYDGVGWILASAINAGKFDQVLLKSQNVLGFDLGGGSLSLAPRTSLSLDAPVIGASNSAIGSTVTLDSAYVRIGNTNPYYQAAGAAATASGGNGILDVNATTVDLAGSSALQGFGATDIDAVEDIRLVGQVDVDLSLPPDKVLPVIHAFGSFTSWGDLDLTARQIYPTTMSEFTLNASGNSSTITFHGNGAIPASPLSAAGTLAINADNIVQDGVLRAPFGKLALTAGDTLSYTANSLTSVAGDSSVPFGQGSNGRDWVYDFGNGHTVTLDNSSATNGVSLPEKAVISTGKHVNMASGAVIDLSGGGDLYAYEFTPGPGGSHDVLAPAKDKDGKPLPITVFAVLPGYDNSVAPVDFQYQQDGGLQAGDRIYLSGIPGLTAGFYTLLPAHYALLPGAYAVAAASGTRDMTAAGNYAKTDGTWVVAGYRGSAVANDSRWSGYLLTPSSLVRTQSEFTNYLGNTFFAGITDILPQNGGHIAFAASETLSLDGLIKLGAIPGGRRGIADISAPDITVVANESQAISGGTKLLAADLAALGADSLLLGGIRDIESDGSHVTVGANSVTLANDADHPLAGPEIILAARDEVRVESKSSISSNGAPASNRDLIVSGSGGDADGALLRVSGGKQVAVVRDSPPGAKGTLTIAADAAVSASGSMNLDATKSLAIEATNSLDKPGPLALGNGAALSLGANRVSFGGEIPDTVDGLRFDSNALTALSSIGDLSLTSYTTFDFYGAATLGREAIASQSATRSLSLRGAGMQFYGNAGDEVLLAADTVRFDGGGSYVLATPASAAAGSLSVKANDIEIGSNGFAIKGYTDVNLTAQREVRAVGKNGAMVAESDMTVAAGRITSASGADATLKSTGILALTTVANPQAPLTNGTLGGKLTFSGNTITSDATIVAKSGQVSFVSGQGVHITGGEIGAGGSAKTFGSTVAYSPGGSIALDGGSGNVTVDEAAVLDVSSVGADAGLVSVKATNGNDGEAVLNGTLKGSAVAGIDGKTPAQGRFSLDVDKVALDIHNVPQFGALNQKLNNAGFNEAREFRVRNDNLTLADGDSIVAHDVLIAADNGSITVGGKIDASGAKGGRIELYAAQAIAAGSSGNVTLLSTAKLLANATAAVASGAGSTGDGGSVVIGTSAADGLAPTWDATLGATGNRIALQSGYQIDATGAGVGRDGTVLLRAPRTVIATGINVGKDDVAVSSFDATGIVAGTGGGVTTTIEGYKVYKVDDGATISGAGADGTTNLNATTGGGMYTDASGFMSNASGILNRLGVAATGVVVNPGVEVRSNGDLTVSVNETATNAKDRGWNLNAWRFGGQPGMLTLRAKGNLTISGSISDGFAKPTANLGMPDWALDPSGGASWSYRLAGGADLDAASPLATKASQTTGDVKVGFARSYQGSTSKDQTVALLRTGSGRIDIAAGRDFILDTLNPETTNALGAVVYTAGRHTSLASGFIAPNARAQTFNPAYSNSSTTVQTTGAEFADGGGAISIAAARDVIGAATYQLVNNWLFRRGQLDSTLTAFKVTGFGTSKETAATSWWSRFDYFNQGIATFAGGDVNIVAGGNVTNLSVNTATNGQVPGTAPVAGSLVERGGGDIDIVAGGDIQGGSYYVQKGEASLTAGGAVRASDHEVKDTSTDILVPLRPILALGDASIRVVAGGDIEIETAFNPMLVRQSTANAADSSAAQYGIFSTYSGDSSVELSSISGNVLLSNNSVAVGSATGLPYASGNKNNYIPLLAYPGSLFVTAYVGDISYQHGFSLWPSPSSNLELLAGGSVIAAYPRSSTGALTSGIPQPIVMLDRDPATMPNIYAPPANAFDFSTFLGKSNGLAYHTNGGLHSGDDEPVRVIALDGDIVGLKVLPSDTSPSDTSDLPLTTSMILPKRAEIIAGRDIVNFGFKIQQLSATDTTVIEAGRDFIDSTLVSGSNVEHTVTGPGFVSISAGRNLDLGNSIGIKTRGNLDNPYLPTQGASVDLVAGATPDYAGFLNSFTAVSDLTAAEQTALVDYLRKLEPALLAGTTPVDAWTAFKSLPAAQRQVFLDTLFFNAVARASGAVGGGTLDLAKFDAEIARLFPEGSIAGGDINVFGSQVRTDRGGDINIFAPGGSVYAGLANMPGFLIKDASSQGIFTVGGGTISSLVNKDFLVNQGRVFTLGGGDITLVSQFGNIDAGRGAKTAVSAPPPVLTTDANGNTQVDISSSITGSGIATLRTGPDVVASNVYPIAPRGVFDAGDAGVRSTGTVSIVAQTVLNANNISAAGSISGAHTAVGGLSGAVAAPSNAPVTKTDAIASTANPDTKSSGTLTVELLGYGGGSGQENVTEDSQNAPPVVTDEDEKKK